MAQSIIVHSQQTLPVYKCVLSPWISISERCLAVASGKCFRLGICCCTVAQQHVARPPPPAYVTAATTVIGLFANVKLRYFALGTQSVEWRGGLYPWRQKANKKEQLLLKDRLTYSPTACTFL
ncbi:hypothetical protein AOLI_G00280690 [Acnodon oligacanthus]